MKARFIWIMIGLVVVGSPFLLRFVDLSDSGASSSEVETLQWRDLRQMAVDGGETPDFLNALDGAYVEIPGFVVPLEDDLETVQQFILVPSAMACIHVPPPPPNQIVHVKLRRGVNTLQLIRPQWVRGTFRIQETAGFYGSALFLIEDAEVETYRTRGF